LFKILNLWFFALIVWAIVALLDDKQLATGHFAICINYIYANITFIIVAWCCYKLFYTQTTKLTNLWNNIDFWKIKGSSLKYSVAWQSYFVLFSFVCWLNSLNVGKCKKSVLLCSQLFFRPCRNFITELRTFIYTCYTTCKR